MPVNYAIHNGLEDRRGSDVATAGPDPAVSARRTVGAGRTLQNAETGHCPAIAPQLVSGADQVLVTTCHSGDARQPWKGGGTP